VPEVSKGEVSCPERAALSAIYGFTLESGLRIQDSGLRTYEAKMTADVRIKGTRKGVTIIIKNGEHQSILKELEARLASSGFFLKGSEVVLEIELEKLGVDGLKEICRIIRNHELTPVKVISESRSVRKAAQALGLEVEKPSSERPEYALVKHGPIRSGQSVNYEGTVLIIGDVNPGAEIVAGGDIIVWGHLKGTAFAGAPDDPTRRIYALALEPTLLGIGTYVARPPEDEAHPGKGPEVALVQGDRIVVELWEQKTHRGES